MFENWEFMYLYYYQLHLAQTLAYTQEFSKAPTT